MSQSALALVQSNWNPARPRIVAQPVISVFGLGYVGAVSMACFADLGYRMVGVDVSPAKIDAINKGEAPIVEERLAELLQEGVVGGLISATGDPERAVEESNITLISVGTPTAKDGSCDMTFVRAAARAIGAGIARKLDYHLVVMRCSVPPGTTMDVVVPELEAASGKRLGEDFGICFNPEFLREGTAVADFFDPPKTVIGASDNDAAEMLAALYRTIDPEIRFCTIGAAEMVKYADNTWHAVKVTFANEIGRCCKAISVDSHEVMDVFVQDQKLNLSAYYLKPGFAFGGSCLPKEVRAMQHLGAEHGIEAPLISSLMTSNQGQIAEALRLIESLGHREVGFLGVAFKSNTDDLRESPTLELMSALISRGYKVSAYDPNLLTGLNIRSHYEYMRNARPDLGALIEALPKILCETTTELEAGSDVLVVSHNTDQFRRVVAGRTHDTHVLDLVRLFPGIPSESTYVGIGW